MRDASQSSRQGSAPLGILAGGSGVPCEVADAVVRRGGSVHIVGLQGEAEPEIARFSHTWVNLGGVGAMLRAFKSHGCKELVIVGRVKRPNLASIRPDFGFWSNLPILLRFLRGGDDAILRMVVGFFERHGLTVVGAHDAAPELIAPVGVLGRHAPRPDDREAIAACAGALSVLGPFDAAQAAVGAAGGLAAVEGADGTDAMLRRLAAGRRVARDGVLVKIPKPGQERRIDLPAVGPETVRRALDAGLGGIAVSSGATLIAERQRTIELADESGLFVLGIAPDDRLLTPRAGDAGLLSGTIDGLAVLAHRRPSETHREDAALGARVLAALQPYWPDASTIVSRGYVLVTEAPGQAVAAAQRAGRLKPWGTRLLRQRSGVLVMSGTDGELGFDPGELARAAAASSLAGIAVLRSPRDEAGLAALRTEVDRYKLFLLAPGDGR